MKRIEILVRDGTKFILRSIYLNPDYIVSVREEELLTKDLQCEQMSKKFPLGLNRSHVLSEVVYSEGNRPVKIIAIGSPEMIQSKISKKQGILRG